jgi:hypothetical protein
VHKAIKDDVIKIEMTRKITDRMILTIFVQLGISKLFQFICYGLLKFVDCISKASLPINKFFSEGGVVQHLFIEYESLFTSANLRQKFIYEFLALSVLK